MEHLCKAERAGAEGLDVSDKAPERPRETRVLESYPVLLPQLGFLLPCAAQLIFFLISWNS